MKLNLNPDQLKALCAAVIAAGGRTFQYQSGDPTNNAQRNLTGLTHYVDTDTLRCFKSKVLSTAILADGLLFRITESCALDMDNTSRGFRCVVFNVFGTVISRPDLEHTFKTSEQAGRASDKKTLDLVTHYREALQSRLHWIERDAAKIKAALAMLNEQPAAIAA